MADFGGNPFADDHCANNDEQDERDLSPVKLRNCGVELEPNTPGADKAKDGRLADIDIPPEDRDAGKSGQHLRYNSVGRHLRARRTARAHRIDLTRVDFLDLSHWGRAVLKDIDFYEVNGNTVFPIYGASGGLAASYIFYFDTAFQVWDDSPRTGAFIDTLARPSGY